MVSIVQRTLDMPVRGSYLCVPSGLRGLVREVCNEEAGRRKEADGRLIKSGRLQLRVMQYPMWKITERTK